MAEVQEKQMLKSISSKLTSLISEVKKPEQQTWVKASVITGLTAWDNQGMRRARENGYVKFKKVDGKFWYILESVNPLLFKTK